MAPPSRGAPAASAGPVPVNAEAEEPLPPPKFSLIDRAMIGLALLSVVFVLIDMVPAIRGRLTEEQFWTIVYADLVITAIFAIEFVASAIKSRSFLGYAKANWYDLIGMVPMIAFVALEAGAFGILRGFRFLRIVRIFVVGSRFLRATNMTFGEKVVQRVFQRYQGIIVQLLATPILMQVLTMAQQTTIRMRYAEAVGKSLDAKRDEIHAAILETLEKNRVPESLITKPLVERILADVEKQVLDNLVATLTADKLNVLIQELVVQTLEDFKQQLASPASREAILRGQERIEAITAKRAPVKAAGKAPVAPRVPPRRE